MTIVLPDARDLPALTILTNPHVQALRQAESELSVARGWPTLPANRVVVAAAVGLPAARRGMVVQRALAEALTTQPGDPVLLTDISLLFEPSLALDPLALLRRLADRRRLVVLWPGSMDDARLCYAVPGHAHYRTWDAHGLKVITL